VRRLAWPSPRQRPPVCLSKSRRFANCEASLGSADRGEVPSDCPPPEARQPNPGNSPRRLPAIHPMARHPKDSVAALVRSTSRSTTQNVVKKKAPGTTRSEPFSLPSPLSFGLAPAAGDSHSCHIRYPGRAGGGIREAERLHLEECNYARDYGYPTSKLSVNEQVRSDASLPHLVSERHRHTRLAGSPVERSSRSRPDEPPAGSRCLWG
jgi:hypothetical protein